MPYLRGGFAPSYLEYYYYSGVGGGRISEIGKPNGSAPALEFGYLGGVGHFSIRKIQPSSVTFRVDIIEGFSRQAVWYPLYRILLSLGAPIRCMNTTHWILRLDGIAQLPAGYPIHRIIRPLVIAQLAAGMQSLGLINNPIIWARNRSADMADDSPGR